ncbi:hypothetical protein D3C84_1239130 [compost metagenome]
MFQEALRALELRRMATIRIDEQLRIRDVPGHVERVDGRDHHVIHAVQNEGRVLDVS